MHLLLLCNSDQYITVSGGTCNMLLYFGCSRERFALLKSPRMIKTESGCCCSVI